MLAKRARRDQNGLLYNPGLFFTTRLQVCFHSRFDIWLERSQVAMQRAMGETACTNSVPCCGFAGSKKEAGAAAAGKALTASSDRPATGQRADRTATRIKLTGNIPHFLSGLPEGTSTPA